MKTAWMFSGQGTQEPGMISDFMHFPEFAKVIRLAENVANRPIGRLMLKGPKEELNLTSNTQVAVIGMALGLLAIHLKRSPDDLPDFVAGHSVGEGAASRASGAIDTDEKTLIWANERGLAMEREGNERPGKMAAVLGMKDAAIRIIARDNGASVANFNIPDSQQVITGGVEEVDAASEEASRKGARRVMPLSVTIAAHSNLMSGAIPDVSLVTKGLHMIDPVVPIVSNASGRLITRAQSLNNALPRQLKRPVRWGKSVEFMHEEGVTEFVEVGYGTVLSGMVTRQLSGKPIVVRHITDLFK